MPPSLPAIVLTGPAGSGKSSTGRELATLLGAALLDLDSLTNALADVAMSALGGSGFDDQHVARTIRSERYEGLFRGAEDCLSVGTPVVLVAPFTSERSSSESWRALEARLRSAGGDPRMAWLRISRDELRERLRRRQAGRDHAKLQDPDSHLSGVDFSPPLIDHIELDATHTASAQAHELFDLLIEPAGASSGE